MVFLYTLKLSYIEKKKIYFLICVCSLELRELEAKLRSAYMNKERTAQIAEKEAIKFDVMVLARLILALILLFCECQILILNFTCPNLLSDMHKNVSICSIFWFAQIIIKEIRIYLMKID